MHDGGLSYQSDHHPPLVGCFGLFSVPTRQHCCVTALVIPVAGLQQESVVFCNPWPAVEEYMDLSCSGHCVHMAFYVKQNSGNVSVIILQYGPVSANEGVHKLFRSSI